ncbi:MAG: hypothetical protein P8M49_08130, partial [Thalassotalea sp.]|nr:hypothetical protein [Thalassotalea sp.]
MKNITITMCLIVLLSGCQSINIETEPDSLIVLNESPVLMVLPKNVAKEVWVDFGVSLGVKVTKGGNIYYSPRDIKYVNSNFPDMHNYIENSKVALKKWSYSMKDINKYGDERFLIRVEASPSRKNVIDCTSGSCNSQKRKPPKKEVSYVHFVGVDALIDVCLHPTEQEYKNFTKNYIYAASLLSQGERNRVKKPSIKFVNSIVDSGGCEGEGVKKLIEELN